MNSRGYQKTSRPPPYPQNPLQQRNINDNYYQGSRNYNTSREFHTGIFTNELNKRDRKKQTELALEFEEVTDYNTSKARTSSKRSVFGRESRDEYYRQSEGYIENSEAFSTKQDLNNLKTEIYQNVTEMFKDQGVRYDKALVQLVSQINIALKKSEENYISVKKESSHLQEELGKLTCHFQVFSKENQEKLETLVNQVASMNGVKKPKAYGDYGVDLKNSFQGLNSSFSVNLGNEPSNSKLVNEVISQLDSLKRELSENKLQLQELSLKLNSNIRDTPTAQTSTATKLDSLLKEDLIATIDKRFREEKKNWKFDEKMESFESKLNTLNEILHKHEENIFGMNEQMSNTFNNQMNPKIKKIQSSIIDLYCKLDPLMIQNQLRQGITRELEQRLKGTRLLKVRNCNKTESSRIGSITGMNEDKLTSRQTYLLDEDGYLLDSQGSYLMEEWAGQKRRVRLQQGQLYLLGLKGIQISSCS